MVCTRRILAAVVLAALPQFALGQEEKKKDAATEALEKQWEEFARVGEEHKQLARLVGEWKTEVKTFYPDPANPETTQGSATFRALMGGRYVQQNFQGEFAGQRFRGMGISGYDNRKKKYVGAWIDTMGTGIMTTEGAYDEKKHELVETGVSSGPTGEEKVKMISRYLDDNKFVFEMYMVDGEGKETKTMEMTYTRTEEKQKNKTEE
jgi:hypothetical protein